VANAEKKWRVLLQSTSDTVTLVDASGNVCQSTGELTDVLGYPPNWWPGQSGFDLIHPDDLPRAAGVFAELLDNPDQTFSEVLRTRHAAGHWELIEYTASNRLDDPHVEAIVITSRNVTDFTRAEAMLADEAEILERIARGGPLPQTLETIASMVDYHTGGDSGLFVLDHHASSLTTCAAPSIPTGLVNALRVHGLRSATGPVLGSHDPEEWPDLTAPDAMADAEVLLAHGYRAGWSQPIVETRDKEILGTLVVLYSAPRIPSERERHVVAVASHLAAIAIERDHSQRKLEHQATHDQLTGLPNRWAIVEHLDSLLEAAVPDRRVAVLVLDIDRFKVVNDSLGHAAGDELLVAFGRRLQAVAGDDAFVGHFGADEFVVIVDDVADLDEAVHVAGHIDLALSKPFRLHHRPSNPNLELHLSASIGAAIAREGDRAHELLQHADAAMYRAKARGRDRMEVFDETLRDRATELLTVDRELRRAVDHADLAVYYQPKIDLDTGGVAGAEALLRWNHPERGVVPPSDFIDVAEETGLIVRIGTWVLDEAVRQARYWVDRMGCTEFTVAVNLSARQLAARGLVADVAQVLERYDWPPQQLTLELTESILIEDAVANVLLLEGLKDLGVKLAIDDFGTGYSSLSYLHRFPVDIVKVDRAFVHPLLGSGAGSPIATAVIHMARALDLVVAAEGVENGQQLEGLRALGCDMAQGFLFAGPLTSNEFGDLLAESPSW
jgi:diguanylate cyclase (GGDEF)-like protein/PAS domain S-box-containing protein